jgi:hypothetical protein
MKWPNPWGSDNSWITANSPNYIDITASAKVIGADGQALQEIVFDGMNLDFWPTIADTGAFRDDSPNPTSRRGRAMSLDRRGHAAKRYMAA